MLEPKQSILSAVWLGVISIVPLARSHDAIWPADPNNHFGDSNFQFSSLRPTAIDHCFHLNKGQLPREVKFSYRADNLEAFFTNDGFTLKLTDRLQFDAPHGKCGMPGDATSPAIRSLSLFPSSIGYQETGQCVQFNFSAGMKRATIEPRTLLPGTETYFRGRGEDDWIVGVPRFESIEYRLADSGARIVFYDHLGFLEYDIELPPGESMDGISFKCAGVESIGLSIEGSLEMRTRHGILHQLEPRAYQIDSHGNRVSIQCNYVVGNDGTILYSTSGADPTRSITIDPVLIYSTYLGGILQDEIYAVATDDSGATYVTGQTNSPDFPFTPGAFDTSVGSGAAFVTKFNADGSLAYSTFLDGAIGYDIKTDSSHNVYFCGGSTLAFPTTPGSYNPTGTGGSSPIAVVAKINPTGSGLVYSTFIGGTSIAYGLAIDSIGEVFITGGESNCCGAPPYPTTPHAYQTVGYPLTGDVFVTKLNVTGSSLAYSTLVGGKPGGGWGGGDVGYAIALDSAGCAYICGETQSASFPVTPGAFQSAIAGGVSNCFVTKLKSNGTGLIYSTYLGGGGSPSLGFGTELANSIAVDSQGCAYVAGRAEYANFPTTFGSFNAGPPVSEMPFLTKFNPSGSALVYSTFVGASGPGGTGGIGLMPDGSIYIAGATNGLDLPTTPGAFQSQFAGGLYDTFIVRINALGNGVIYSTYLGGPGDTGEGASGMAVSPDGVVHVAGVTNSATFPVTQNALSKNLGNPTTTMFDGFVTTLLPEITGPGLTNYGTGTPGCLGAHVMQATYPQVGNALFSLSSTAAPAGALGLALVADHADVAGSDPFGLGTQLLLDFASSTTILGIDLPSNDVGGSAALLPIPNAPWLANQTFYAQAIWLWPQGPQCGPAWNAPFGLSSSNGIAITIQP